jgi:hypothetical protein
MKLTDIVKEMLDEAIHVQTPQPRIPDNDDDSGPVGYRVKSIQVDPHTGRSETELEPEPSLLKMAKEIYRMKQEMKYYVLLDTTKDDPDIANYLQAEAKSIITSLQNAEGKIRQLYKQIKASEKFKK